MNNIDKNDEFIDLSEIVSAFKKHWKWFPVAVFVCLAAAFVYLKMATPIYDISTKIFIKNDNSAGSLNSTMASLTGLDLMPSKDEVEDKIEVIKSMTISEQMVRELKLYINYIDKSGFRAREMYGKDSPLAVGCEAALPDTITIPLLIEIEKPKGGNTAVRLLVKKKNIASYSIEKFPALLETPYGKLLFTPNGTLPDSYEYAVAISDISHTAAAYCNSLGVAQIAKYSSVFVLSRHDNIPQRGKDILDKLVELYNKDAIEDKNITFQNTEVFLEERLKIIARELSDVEKTVETYKKDNNLADIEEQAKLLITTSGEFQQKLMEMEMQLSLVQFIENSLKKEKKYALLPANLGISDEALVAQITDYNKMILERNRLLRSSNPENPVVLQSEEQLQMGSDNILKSIRNIKAGFEIAKKEISGKNAANEGKIKAVPTQEKEFIEIKRQQQIKETLYLFLLQKREETALSLAITAPIAKTIDRARASFKPVSPRKKVVCGAALAIGVLLPLLLLIVLTYFDTKIKSRADLEKLLNDNVPVLGEIGLHSENEEIVVKDGSNTPISEMFRIVRTNLSFLLNGNRKVILVTSTVSGEGKSFCATNLAVSFALTGKKVLLVGLDIRNPQLSKYLHLANKKGITNFISDETLTADDLLQPSGINDNLQTIVSGTIPPNPSELLLSPRLDELLATLRERFDYIILDTAPVGIVTDTFLLNRVADTTMYVCKQGFTEKPMVKFINEIYKDNKLAKLSVLLNGTDGRSSYGYGYGYTKK
ncbi:MAG: polysaccharide biosynthesis tyrosine autokinase [Prevotellaceae bacterium]|jgi:capsular exopolysaccharide synthesis family protein|nr:polysaccharide biosynthesis tyrosine autokinase [Prevotellaceae bacterium]